MNPLPSILTGLLVAGSFLHAQEVRILNEDFLSGLRRDAALTHPSADAARQRAAAAGHDARAVRLWDDPMVGLGFMAAEKMMRADDGDIIVSFEQPLPKPGMFDARKRKAEAMRRAETENSRSPALAAGAEAAR